MKNEQRFGGRADHPLLIIHALAGDLLMASPTLRAIHAHFSGNLTVVCGTEPEHQALLRNIGFQRLVTTEFRTRAPHEGEEVVIPADWCFDVDAVVSKVKGCDLLINLTESGGPDFDRLAKNLGVPSLGFHSEASHFIDWGNGPAHTIDNYFQVAQALDENAWLVDHAWLPHHPGARDIRQAVREEVGSAEFLVIHADTKPNKMWPLPFWAQWLKNVWASEPDQKIILVGYPAISIENFATDSRLIDCRDIPLTVAYEIVSMATVFVGIDSCMLHAADLCRVPSVGIFTQEYPREAVGFKFSDSISLIGQNPPATISVDAVYQAYRTLKGRQWKTTT